MQCTSCRRELALRSAERIGFRDACACGADLHVCRNCAHHDPSVYNECRETSAERVGDRDRANRCEWFVPREGLPAAPDARAALDGLLKKLP